VVAIAPIPRRYSERLALGFILARTVEVLTHAISAIGLLTLLTVSRTSVEAGPPEVPSSTPSAICSLQGASG
jgi:hypothetical protein